MIKKMVNLVICVIFIILLSCGGAGELTVLPEQINDNVVLIGGLLVENAGLGYDFETREESIEVLILVRADTPDAQLKTYTVNTDREGYFILPNIPRGKYIIKGFSIPLAGKRPVRVINDWEMASSKYYMPRRQELPIPEEAAYLSPMSDDKVQNLGILVFQLLPSVIDTQGQKEINRTVIGRFESFKNKLFALQIPYSRQNPLDYYKAKYPTSGWFK